MTPTDEGMKSRVEVGASWLDENYPNWAGSINLNRLQMNSCHGCIIGQAVGNYYATIAKATEYDSDVEIWAIDNGFQAPPFYSDSEYDLKAEREYYRSLEDLWTEEVRNRVTV